MAIAKPMYKKAVSVVICTLDREDSLREAIMSLCKQSYRNFEIVVLTDRGNLSKIRDTGLKASCGNIVVFIDDDVVCPEHWLQNMVSIFQKGAVGVSGPTVISNEDNANRDVFRFRWCKKLHDRLFLGKDRRVPGFLSSCGTPSLASCGEEGSGDQNDTSEVDYLEACNMGVRRNQALLVGGFDTAFKGTSEWCEVDLALRMRKYGNLLYSKGAKLYHRPSKEGVYSARLRTRHRWKNFIYFQKKWEGKFIKKGFKTNLYRAFVWVYFKLKGAGLI